jgi:hypothetical protein
VLYVILAWIAAVLVTVVILGFCAYELTWKLRRLRGDAEKLQKTIGQLAEMQLELNVIQQRAAALRQTSVPEG